MKLILARHAQTLENAKRIIQGSNIGTLSPLGKEQARKLARRLKNEDIYFIYCSDLQRTKDTAEEIANFHNIKVTYTNELRERNMGPFEGQKWDSIDFDLASYYIEPIEKVLIRAKNIVEKIYQKHKDKTVLIIAHASFLKCVILNFSDKSESRYLTAKRISNASISIVDMNDKDHSIKLLNCIQHLE